MALGKRGDGVKTTWLQLSGKKGVLTAWNRDTQSEDEYSFVAGTVQRVDVEEKKYGDNVGYVVRIGLRDPESGERYVVETGAGSRVTTRLLGQLNNADLGQTLYIAPYMMHAGDDMGNGSKVNRDTAMTSVKYVQGVKGDSLELSDGIKPFYGEGYAHGDRLPAPVVITKPDGTPLKQNGQDVVDRSEIEQLCASLAESLQHKLGRHPADTQGEGDGEGIDADAAVSAARQSMAQRG